MLETARWCAAGTSVIWRAVFKKKNMKIQTQNSCTKTQKYRSKYNLLREKEITARYWRHSLLNPLRQLTRKTAFCLQTGGRNSPHPGPRSLWEGGLRMSFHFHRPRCPCQGQRSGKARWKGPDVCRGGGAGGAEGGLAVAARETSVGGQKSCHPQIIRKIKNRNSEVGQSLNLKLSCLERVYQKKKKKTLQ